MKGKKVYVTEENIVWDGSPQSEPPALNGRKNPEKPKENGGEENNKGRNGWRLKREKQREEKQKEEKMWRINKCAEWCKMRLPSKQRECIEKVMEQLRTEKGLGREDGFLEQIEYYGYMFFWQKYHKGEKWRDERDIYYALEIWAEKMKNEEEALEHNYLLVKTVRELKKGRSTDELCEEVNHNGGV